MNRMEFLRQLEELLYDVPECERREAMEYYRNYFDDAGSEKEEEIIEKLGSPKKVAESIKRDLFGEDGNSLEFEKKKENPKTDKTTRNVFIALILVLTFPVWIGLIVGALGISTAAILCLFAFAVCIAALVGTLFIMGAVLAGAGIAQIFTGMPAAGLIILGIGFLLLACGMISLVVTVWAIGWILPWLIRAVVHAVRIPFQKRGAAI